ncbi:hypothetical protein [Pseudomonas sp.]|uniref:hypothetical protein n=1 Tax=Pseudomonas sp. TaxID=306 RepID=UPI00333FD9B7
MSITAPIRGLRNVEGSLFVVAGDKILRINTAGVATELGIIPGVGRVSISHNQIAGGNEVIVVNGTSGYVYNTVSQTLTQITDEGYPGAIVADYVDSYLVQVEPFRRFWFHSDLANALEYNTLDRYEAEASPDRMVTLAVFFREVWVFSERTTEVYVNTGAATGTFQRATGSVIEKGCAGRFAVGKTDSGLFWLGDDGVIYRANGYTPERISTHPIESVIASLDKSSCYTMVWEDEGHSVIYFAFPNGPTFGFDASTGLWHRRESQGLKGWRIGHLERWNGKYIAGDIYGGGLFELDWDTYTEGDAPLICKRTSGTFADAQTELSYSQLELVMDTGSADNHAVQVAYSDDFGRNYTNWKERSLGNIGQYAKRVRFFRLGRSRNRIWQIRVSSAGKRDLISASLTVQGAEE